VQLLRLRPAFDGSEVTFATVKESYRGDVEGADFRVVPDCNLDSKLAILRSALAILLLVWRLKPDVVVSTGAAPGYFAVKFAKWFGRRTVWLDSVANAEVMSLSGQKIGDSADLWLTQWPHLAAEEKPGPRFLGRVF